jgi:hypothetical protein
MNSHTIADVGQGVQGMNPLPEGREPGDTPLHDRHTNKETSEISR